MRILHFVTAGFSGATNVARDIILACNKTDNIQSHMVLRRRNSTKKERIDHFISLGIDTHSVTGRVNLLSIYQLYVICKNFEPDILVVHGFSEHLWGRYAGILARVPYMIHVEHNSKEPYTWFRLMQARWLNRYTDKIVGCSKGVESTLLKLGCPPSKTTSIPNGIHLDSLKGITSIPFDQRRAELIMASRFARQKDQKSLIQAMSILKNEGIDIVLNFAGEGNKRHLKKAKKLTSQLNLNDNIRFLGHCSDLPTRLNQTKFFILSTHFEGMPLALIEAMAAGCSVIASDVVGVKEMLDHKIDGHLVPPRNPEALANTIKYLLSNNDEAKNVAKTGQQKALKDFTIDKMANNYKALFRSLIDKKNSNT